MYSNLNEELSDTETDTENNSALENTNKFDVGNIIRNRDDM